MADVRLYGKQGGKKDEQKIIKEPLFLYSITAPPINRSLNALSPESEEVVARRRKVVLGRGSKR